MLGVLSSFSTAERGSPGRIPRGPFLLAAAPGGGGGIPTRGRVQQCNGSSCRAQGPIGLWGPIPMPEGAPGGARGIHHYPKVSPEISRGLAVQFRGRRALHERRFVQNSRRHSSQRRRCCRMGGRNKRPKLSSQRRRIQEHRA